MKLKREKKGDRMGESMYVCMYVRERRKAEIDQKKAEKKIK